MNRVITVLGALACLLAWRGHAGAQTPRLGLRLGLLALESEDVQDDALAPRLTQELREQLGKRGDVTVVDTHVSLHQVSVGQNCNPAEASCLQKVTESLKLDGLLFGKVTHEGGVPIAVTRRYDKKAGSIQSWAIVSFESNTVTDAQLKEQTQTLVATLLGAAAEQKLADAKPQPETPTPPADGEPGDSAKDAQLSQSLQASSGGMSARTVAGIALLGGAAASVGLSIFSFTQVNSAQHNAGYEAYRLAVGQMNANVKDVCSEASANNRYNLTADSFKDAKNACSKGQTFEILQYVFIGGAVLTGGLATYLLVGGKSDTPPPAEASARLTLHPAIARGGASLTARLRF